MEKADQIFKYALAIQRLKKDIASNYYEIGKILREIKEKKLYKFYGEHIRTFEDLLEEEEFSFKRRTAYYLIEISKFPKETILQIGGYERTVRLLPYLKKDQTIAERVKGLPRKEFDKFLLELKGKDGDCLHEEKEYFILVRCKRCKKTLKFQRINKEDINIEI